MATPQCVYFRKCGGCSYQDMDYPLQIEMKKKRIAEAIGIDDIKAFLGKEYFYRHRMDMIFHGDGLGFREKGKWYNIVDIERCVISNEKLNSLIAEIRGFFTDVDVFKVREKVGTFRYAVMRTPPDDSSVSIVVNKDSPHLDEAKKKIEELATKTTVQNVLITYVPLNRDVSVSDEFSVLKGKEWLREDYLGRKFWYPIQGFFQNNHEVAEKMHSYVRDLLEDARPEEAYLLDLYGGVGTFSFVNADLFSHVNIIENSQQAIEAASKNIEENKISNVKPKLLEGKHLKQIDLPKPLFVIADPPRSGIHPKALRRLNEIQPERILYVSCNERQLREDLRKLENYRIKSAALFDLFPQTPHIETVIELAPKAK